MKRECPCKYETVGCEEVCGDPHELSESTGTTLLPCPFCGGICKKCDCDETDCGRIICTKCKGEFTWHDSDFAFNKMSFNKRAR